MGSVTTPTLRIMVVVPTGERVGLNGTLDLSAVSLVSADDPAVRAAMRALEEYWANEGGRPDGAQERSVASPATVIGVAFACPLASDAGGYIEVETGHA